jgi:chromosome partitioning protein
MDVHPKVLTMVNPKGGTGKSTSGINIAVAASERDLAVALVDTDPQASAVMWKDARQHESPRVLAMQPRNLPAWLTSEGRDFDLVVVDTPAHDTETLSTVVQIANLSLIVTQPTRLAIAVAAHLQRALINADISYAILLSQTPPRLTARLTAWLENYRLLGTVVNAQFAYRVAYQDAVPLGLGVVEYEPHGPAANEVRRATDWILNELEISR